MSPHERPERDGPSDQALENFVQIVGDALERSNPDWHVIPRKPGRRPPPGSRYLPLAAKRPPPSPPGERKS